MHKRDAYVIFIPHSNELEKCELYPYSRDMSHRDSHVVFVNLTNFDIEVSFTDDTVAKPPIFSVKPGWGSREKIKMSKDTEPGQECEYIVPCQGANITPGSPTGNPRIVIPEQR